MIKVVNFEKKYFFSQFVLVILTVGTVDGVALGSGAIVAASISAHINKPITIDIKRPPHLIVSSTFWSILATLLFVLLTWLWIKRKAKS